MDAKVLKFDKQLEGNEAFHPGLNLSVRQGVYWSTQLKAGTDLSLENLEGDVLGVAFVVSTRVFRFIDIPEHMLMYEHNQSLTNKRALLDALGEVYPGFTQFDIVTCIFFSCPGGGE